MGQAVKDVKEVQCRKLAIKDLNRDQRGSQAWLQEQQGVQPYVAKV